MYLVDRDVLSSPPRPERTPGMAAWCAKQTESDLVLSVGTLGEIARGITPQRGPNPVFAADLDAR